VQATHGGGFNGHFSEKKTYEWLEEHFLVCWRMFAKWSRYVLCVRRLKAKSA
jgi:hypothetical protein